MRPDIGVAAGFDLVDHAAHPRHHAPMRLLLLGAVFVSVVASAACGEEAAPIVAPPKVPTTDTSTQIISTHTAGTPAELRDRADKALMARRYAEAIEPLEALRAAEPESKQAAEVLRDLGISYEAVGKRDRAKERYKEAWTKFPDSASARTALLAYANLVAYTEDWEELDKTAAILLARRADDVVRITGLGARGLSRIERTKDDVAAMRDVQDGLDLADQLHYGASGRLPVGAAQLKFALAEVRRTRSEKITFANVVTEEFMGKFEMRCALLLDAQSAYSDAIRSEDPRWAAMSGFRIGEMYQTIHRDLMAIPPVKLAKTKEDKDVFYSIMHVRYRVLLEKAGDMMDRTIALGEKLDENSSWIDKSRATKKAIEKAIEDEKEIIKKLPYSEDDVQKALEIMKRKAGAKAEKEAEERQKKAEKAEKKTKP